MSSVAESNSRPYGRGMLARLTRLLAVATLVLMSFAMASGPATAAPAGHPAAAVEHCGDRPQHDPAPAKADCAMSCSALPASHEPPFDEASLPKAPRVALRESRFLGIVPEIATPPPKHA